MSKNSPLTHHKISLFKKDLNTNFTIFWIKKCMEICHNTTILTLMLWKNEYLIKCTLSSVKIFHVLISCKSNWIYDFFSLKFLGVWLFLELFRSKSPTKDWVCFKLISSNKNQHKSANELQNKIVLPDKNVS